MTTILITGANKGLGHETARRLIALGHDVWMGARDEASGRAAAEELGGRHVTLDVTDEASVAGARTQIAEAGALDVLINNAGISASRRPVLETDPDEMTAILATNVVGPVRVALAFRPLLDASDAPVIVNVSGGLGSLTQTSTAGSPRQAYDGLDYPTSKAALNMITLKLAHALPRHRVNAVAPGFTATALNDFSGHRTVAQGADVIVRAATLGPDGPTGTFFDDQGSVDW